MSASAGEIVFDPAVSVYNLPVLTASSLTVTANAIDGATLEIDGATALSGTPSPAIALDAVDNTIAIDVTYGDVTVRYSIVATRLVQQMAYLKASNAASGDAFGFAVAAAGDTVIVGAPDEDGSASSTAAAPDDLATHAGAVYVFVREGASWRQQAYIKASNVDANDGFGSSVAIERNTMVVGAPLEDGNAQSTSEAPNNGTNDAGAAYVFVRSGDAWLQQAYLKAANAGSFDAFGGAVAIADGVVAVGARFEAGDASSTTAAPNDNANQAGAAYLFQNTGTGWTQLAYLKASNAESQDNFGSTIAISGGVVAVGAPYESGGASSTATSPNENQRSAGAVYVFEGAATSWTQTAYLKTHDAHAGDGFGSGVAVDGDSIVATAIGEDGDGASTLSAGNDNAENAGAAYVFVRTDAAWSEQAYLKGVNAGASDQLSGIAIAGDLIVAGAPGEAGDATSTSSAPNDNVQGAGAAYVFGRGGTTWVPGQYLKASHPGLSASFGVKVAIADTMIVVGASQEAGDATSTAETPNTNALGAGAVYVFGL